MSDALTLHYGADPGSARVALACVMGPPLEPGSIRADRWSVDTSTAAACAPVVAEIVKALLKGRGSVLDRRAEQGIVTDAPTVCLWIEWGILYCRPYPWESIDQFAKRAARTSQAHADMTRLVEEIERACVAINVPTARVNVQSWRSRCRVLNPKGPDGKSLLTADRRVRDALALLVPESVLRDKITNPDLADALGVAIGGMVGAPASVGGGVTRRRGKRGQPAKATPAAVERHRVARKAKRAAERGPGPRVQKCSKCKGPRVGHLRGLPCPPLASGHATP